jgi:hypothetical protein
LLYTNTVKMRRSAIPVIAALVALPAVAILAWTGHTAAIEFTELAQRAGIRAQRRIVAGRASEPARNGVYLFGLGACGKVDRVTVTWPSGTVQVVSDPAVNRYTTIEEPR